MGKRTTILVLIFIAAVMVVIAVVAARERGSQDAQAALDRGPNSSTNGASQPPRAGQPNGLASFREIAKAEMPGKVLRSFTGTRFVFNS